MIVIRCRHANCDFLTCEDTCPHRDMDLILNEDLEGSLRQAVDLSARIKARREFMRALAGRKFF